jgi:hypothetical protein
MSLWYRRSAHNTYCNWLRKCPDDQGGELQCYARHPSHDKLVARLGALAQAGQRSATVHNAGLATIDLESSNTVRSNWEPTEEYHRTAIRATYQTPGNIVVILTQLSPSHESHLPLIYSSLHQTTLIVYRHPLPDSFDIFQHHFSRPLNHPSSNFIVRASSLRPCFS